MGDHNTVELWQPSGQLFIIFPKIVLHDAEHVGAHMKGFVDFTGWLNGCWNEWNEEMKSYRVKMDIEPVLLSEAESVSFIWMWLFDFQDIN